MEGDAEVGAADGFGSQRGAISEPCTAYLRPLVEHLGCMVVNSDLGQGLYFHITERYSVPFYREGLNVQAGGLWSSSACPHVTSRSVSNTLKNEVL